MLRFGSYVRLTGERLARAEGFFARHGGKIVVIARFVQVLRQLNGIIAGLGGMTWPRFLIFNAIGAALWVGTWATLGYLAGNHIGTIYTYAARYSLYLLILAGVAVAAFVTRAVFRRGVDPRSRRGPEECPFLGDVFGGRWRCARRSRGCLMRWRTGGRSGSAARRPPRCWRR